MKVLVCGSRDFTDFKIVHVVLMGVLRHHPGFHLIQGGAKGADRIARTFAETQGWPTTEFRADWKLHGKGAGPIRNQQMLDEGEPRLVLAFVNKPLVESKGTADMVRRARAAGIPTYVIEGPPNPTGPPRRVTGVDGRRVESVGASDNYPASTPQA